MSYAPPTLPHLPIISTPVQDEDETDTRKLPSTPSPQAVDELHSPTITSANRSDVVSKMLSPHLVTVNDDEVIVSSTTVSLPELYEAREDHDEYESDANSTRPSPANSPLITTSRRIPPMDIQQKMLYQSISSIASPIRAEDYMPQLEVGPEREVYFHHESLGIKISRHTDGYVRVLSVAPYRAIVGSALVREGQINEGDVVREVSNVNLRMPIDSAVWKLTVGLIKMAPRPLKFVVAKEFELREDECSFEDVGSTMTMSGSSNPTRAMIPWEDSSTQQPLHNAQSAQQDSRFGPTREINFFETALGVKLHHNSDGYVQIISVTPYQPFPNSPMARTGDMKAGDIVLEVGGVWDLREPLDDTSWGALIKFIRETRRPLCMIVADGDGLRISAPEEENEDEQRQEKEGESSTEADGDKEQDDVANNANQTPEISSSSVPSQEAPEICKALRDELSIDALQKGLEKDS